MKILQKQDIYSLIAKLDEILAFDELEFISLKDEVKSDIRKKIVKLEKIQTYLETGEGDDDIYDEYEDIRNEYQEKCKPIKKEIESRFERAK